MMPPPDQDLEPLPATAPGWMVTFADLLSLLLSFFVLMFATTTVDRKDWVRVIQPIAAYLGGPVDHSPEVVAPPPPVPARFDRLYVAALLTRLTQESPALAGAGVEVQEHGVLLSLRPGADAKALADTPAPLTDLVRLVGTLDNRVEVLAHLGGEETPGVIGVDKWRQALDQALAVAAEFKRLGYDRPLPVSGAVDLPVGPAAEGATPKGAVPSGTLPVRIDILIQDVAGEAGPHAAP